MNFSKSLNDLHALYATSDTTKKCYSDCLELFVSYMEQLQSQVKSAQAKKISTKDELNTLCATYSQNPNCIALVKALEGATSLQQVASIVDGFEGFEGDPDCSTFFVKLLNHSVAESVTRRLSKQGIPCFQEKIDLIKTTLSL